MPCPLIFRKQNDRKIEAYARVSDYNEIIREITKINVFYNLTLFRSLIENIFKVLRAI